MAANSSDCVTKATSTTPATAASRTPTGLSFRIWIAPTRLSSVGSASCSATRYIPTIR